MAHAVRDSGAFQFIDNGPKLHKFKNLKTSLSNASSSTALADKKRSLKDQK